MPTPLAHFLLALALATAVTVAFERIDNRAERMRAAEMVQAARQAQQWLHAQPVRSVQEAQR